MKEIKIEYIFFIFLAFSLSIFVKSLRQYFFLKQISIKISFKENIIIYLAGLSMIISPGGMGEIIKSHFLRENHNISISKTSPIVLIERYHDALAIFSILVINASALILLMFLLASLIITTLLLCV